jgi:hypothetical protein
MKPSSETAAPMIVLPISTLLQLVVSANPAMIGMRSRPPNLPRFIGRRMSSSVRISIAGPLLSIPASDGSSKGRRVLELVEPTTHLHSAWRAPGMVPLQSH